MKVVKNKELFKRLYFNLIATNISPTLNSLSIIVPFVQVKVLHQVVLPLVLQQPWEWLGQTLCCLMYNVLFHGREKSTITERSRGCS